MRSREVGQVSFNMRDGYERRLYEHAHKTEHGEFSKYIKRLIERDLCGVPPNVSVVPSAVITEEIDVTTFL